SRGVGLGTHPQLIGILKRAGVDFDDTMGITPTRAVCLDHDGTIVIERPTARTLSGWSRLYRALLDALPAANYRLGKRLVGVAQDANSVTASFADGTSECGDLLVGADGIRSAVRAQFLPDVEPHYAGYVAWRASIDEADVPAELWDEMVGLYAFCLPEGEQVISYAVPGRDNDTAVGRRAYNIVWYRPANRAALTDMCIDAQGRHYAAADPARRDRPRQSRRAGAYRTTGCRNLCAQRAVLPADLRACVAADRVRPCGARRRRRVRGTPACRRRHHQGGARCRLPRRQHPRGGRRSRARPAALPAHAAAVRPRAGRGQQYGGRLFERADQAGGRAHRR